MGYDSNTKTITIGPGSDVLADSGVHFVHVHRDIALKKDSSEGIKRDWKILEDWLGCQGRELTAADDQRIRMAWMGYYAVGLAPSFNLQPVYDLFATQHDVKEFKKHKPPTAVMDVFDRMQASDEEIAKKRAHDEAIAKSQIRAALNLPKSKPLLTVKPANQSAGYLADTKKLANAIFTVLTIGWGLWLNKETDGFRYVKPQGWLVIIAVPLAAFFALPPVIDFLKKANSDVRKVFSANVMWVFAVAAWGFVFDWRDHFYDGERFAALLILPVAGSWLGLGLWKWSKSK